MSQMCNLVGIMYNNINDVRNSNMSSPSKCIHITFRRSIFLKHETSSCSLIPPPPPPPGATPLMHSLERRMWFSGAYIQNVERTRAFIAYSILYACIANTIRASVDDLYRDGAGQISRDLHKQTPPNALRTLGQGFKTDFKSLKCQYLHNYA